MKALTFVGGAETSATHKQSISGYPLNGQEQIALHVELGVTRVLAASFDECLDALSLTRGEISHQVARRVRKGNSGAGEAGTGR